MISKQRDCSEFSSENAKKIAIMSHLPQYGCSLQRESSKNVQQRWRLNWTFDKGIMEWRNQPLSFPFSSS